MRGEVRREQVVQAALRVIGGKKGVGGLTTAAIANEAGMSEANLYRHFKNKDEIALVAIESIGDAIRRNFEKAFSAEPPALKGLEAFFRLHLDLMKQNSGIPRFMFSEELHGKKRLREKVLKTMHSLIDRLASVVSEGRKEGSLSPDADPKTTAQMFIGMVQGLAFRWSLSGFSFSLVDEGMKLWKNFEKCLTARAGGRRKAGR